MEIEDRLFKEGANHENQAEMEGGSKIVHVVNRKKKKKKNQCIDLVSGGIRITMKMSTRNSIEMVLC